MYQQNCTASLGSQTRAIKAQHILTRAALPCKVVRITANGGGRGCAYGIEFPYSLQDEVKSTLASNKISVRSFDCGEGSR